MKRGALQKHFVSGTLAPNLKSVRKVEGSYSRQPMRNSLRYRAILRRETMEGLMRRTSKLVGLAGAILALSLVAACSNQPDPAQQAVNAANRADQAASRAEAASQRAQQAAAQAQAAASRVEQAASDAKAAADRAEAIASKTTAGTTMHRHVHHHHHAAASDSGAAPAAAPSDSGAAPAPATP